MTTTLSNLCTDIPALPLNIGHRLKLIPDDYEVSPGCLIPYLWFSSDAKSVPALSTTARAITGEYHWKSEMAYHSSWLIALHTDTSKASMPTETLYVFFGAVEPLYQQRLRPGEDHLWHGHGASFEQVVPSLVIEIW